MKVPRNRIAIIGKRTRIAPAVTCSIVPADMSEFCNLALGQEPAIARNRDITFQDYGRAPTAHTGDVQKSPSDVNRPSDLREGLSILPASNLLEYRPYGGDHNHDRHKSDNNS